jgi:hypothetical protein
MIDFSAIEGELAAQIGAADGFCTSECGRIRQAIPVSDMPALDISAEGHGTRMDANREYDIPILCIIRRAGFDRTENATEFKVLVEKVCASLEDYQGTAFDVVRNISSKITGVRTRGGSLVRTAEITFVCKAHDRRQ